MTTGVAVLGSTGSIGRAALPVLARRTDRFRVVALTANVSADLLEAQARETAADFVGLVQGKSAQAHGAPPHAGAECLIAAATHPDVHIVINAMVGAAGLPAPSCGLLRRRCGVGREELARVRLECQHRRQAANRG